MSEIYPPRPGQNAPASNDAAPVAGDIGFPPGELAGTGWPDMPQARATEVSRSAQPAAGRGAPWPVWKLSVLLYVFAAGAVAINLFMLGLMFQTFGLPALSPVTTLILAGPLGVPAAWAAGRWVHGLLREAEEPAPKG